MNVQRTKLVACATVIEEALPLLPEGMSCEILDFGLHLDPQVLRDTLQQKIDSLDGEVDTIILGYGLCSQAVVGLNSNTCTLIVPRVDDCIAIFLGSHAAQRKQTAKEPGTYYLTKGWIEAQDTPFSTHDLLVERYGKERAERMTGLMLKNYTRLAFIDTGLYKQERFRAYARAAAKRFNLRYEEIPGSTALIEKMIHGPWDDDFVVVGPGEPIRFADFRIEAKAASEMTSVAWSLQEVS